MIVAPEVSAATVTATGASASAVPATAVVIPAGLAMFVPVKANAPAPPRLVLLTFTVGSSVLVRLQVMFAPATALAPGIVTTLPAKPPKLAAPLPSSAPFASVQLAPVSA